MSLIYRKHSKLNHIYRKKCHVNFKLFKSLWVGVQFSLAKIRLTKLKTEVFSSKLTTRSSPGFKPPKRKLLKIIMDILLLHNESF